MPNVSQIVGLYFLTGFYKLKVRNKLDYREAMVFVSFIGLLVAQLSNADLIICNGITWGLMLCITDAIFKNKTINIYTSYS